MSNFDNILPVNDSWDKLISNTGLTFDDALLDTNNPILDNVPSAIIYGYENGYITLDFIEYLKQNGFFTKPASLKYHGACVGGLYQHSVNVCNKLVEFTRDNHLKWQNDRSPYLIGLFHDLCKMDNYSFKPIESDDELSYEWNKSQLIKGHGDKSVMMLAQFFKLTVEEIMCIRYHMGAYETDNWDEYDRAIRDYPNVLWTHMADMYASKVMEE